MSDDGIYIKQIIQGSPYDRLVRRVASRPVVAPSQAEGDRQMSTEQRKRPICVLPIDHDGECQTKAGTTTEWAHHPGETVDGIRELAIIDRYYARDDLSNAGLPV